MLFFKIIETWINWSLTSGSKYLEYLLISYFWSPMITNFQGKKSETKKGPVTRCKFFYRRDDEMIQNLQGRQN